MVRYLMRMHYVYSGTYPTEVAKWTRKRTEKTNMKMDIELAEPALEQASRNHSRNRPAKPAHRPAHRNRSRQRDRRPFWPAAGTNRLKPEEPADRTASRSPSGTNRPTGRRAETTAERETEYVFGPQPERTGSSRKNRLTDRPAGPPAEANRPPAELSAEIPSLRTVLGLMPRNIPF